MKSQILTAVTAVALVAAGAASAGPAVVGTIKALDSTRNSVTLSTGDSFELPASAIEADLQVGSKVVVFTDDRDQDRATSVVVRN